VTIDGARGILFNVTGGPNLSLYEINQAASIIRETAHPDVNLIFGAVIDENMGDDIRITVIATGFEHGMPLVRQLSRPVSQTSPREVPGQEPMRESVPVGASAKRSNSEPSNMVQPDYRINDLDIPAFLRKRR
jgi:cell division protein FtsZ